MPQQLHPRELDLLRSLKKTAIVLMVLFRLDRPPGECEIARILDLNLETVRIYLRSLARSGLVTRTHRYHGWILTAGGRQMVLGEGAAAGHIQSGIQGDKIKTSAKIPPSTAEISRSRSRVKPRMRKAKSQDRTANGSADSDQRVQAYLDAFASIGLVRNAFISRICQMDHVTPGYTFGQKKRLQAERRYSAGLLLKVIQCKDFLPENYRICDSSPPLSTAAAEENVEQGDSSQHQSSAPSDALHRRCRSRATLSVTAPKQRSPAVEPDPSMNPCPHLA